MSEPTLECLNSNPDSACHGTVEFHSIDPGRTQAWPRCTTHWNQRLQKRENSMERYENSDLAPSWFDPTYAGERWDDDY